MNSQNKPSKVAILTSGGLAPCLSSAVGYLIETYTRESPSTQIICYLNGYRGLLLGDSIEVTEKIRQQASKLQNLGGSPIGNSRVRLKNAQDCVKRGLVKSGESPERVAALRLIRDGITILHTIGGDDTNMSAGDLSAYLSREFDDYKLSVVGLPKTIDNDVKPISQTLGAQTAAEQGALFFRNVVSEYSANPNTLIVHEIMGRNSGWLASKTAQVHLSRNSHAFPDLISRKKTSVHAVYIPEATFRVNHEAARLREIMISQGCVNVFLSEGSCSEIILKEMEESGQKAERDAFGHVRLDTLNPGKWFSEVMAEKIGAEKVLVQKSGYFCRAAPANDFDRRLARACCEKAVEYAMAGKTGLCGLDEDHNDEIRCIDYSRVSGGKPFNLQLDWFRKMMKEIGQEIIPLQHKQNPQFFSYKPADISDDETPRERNIDYSGLQSTSHLVSISTVSLLPVSSEEADRVLDLIDRAGITKKTEIGEIVYSLMACFKNMALALKDVQCSDGSTSFKSMANSLFQRFFSDVKNISKLASLDRMDPLISNDEVKNGFSVIIDPADGSSNIDANVSVGSIFGIYNDDLAEKSKDEKKSLRKGENLVASGYCLYGSATIMMITFRKGVYGFTLDAENNRFVLSYDAIKMPLEGIFYSANEAYWDQWDLKTKKFLKKCKEDKMRLRYIGTFVADFHRTLLYGGIFLYPGNIMNPNGKLKILSEVSPLALLTEEAGGKAVDMKGTRVLTKSTDSLNQSTEIIIGSPVYVDDLVKG